MKKLKKVLVLVVLSSLMLFAFTACASKPGTEVQPVEGDVTELANNFVDYLVTENYNTAISMFDETMSRAMSVSVLEQTWEQLQQQVGTFEERVDNRVEEIQGYEAVFVTSKFELALIDIRVVFDSNKQIAGLFFEPTKN